MTTPTKKIRTLVLIGRASESHDSDSAPIVEDVGSWLVQVRCRDAGCPWRVTGQPGHVTMIKTTEST